MKRYPSDKTALVLGGGGFVGAHLVNALTARGWRVRAADMKRPEFLETTADEYLIGDLRDTRFVAEAFGGEFDQIYQLAADMGGAGYVFSGENDADIMRNSAQINLNVIDAVRRRTSGKIFFSSSACVYPSTPQAAHYEEASAYPANPASEYGWEKLFAERLYLNHARNHGVAVAIGRFHTVFGPHGAWAGGKEKAPAAICRKVAEAEETVEIWGDGLQSRSFLYIDDCIEGAIRLMESQHAGPVNIGSDELITINDLAQMTISISQKNLRIVNIDGPTGPRSRNSDNTLIRKYLNWTPTWRLRDGMEITYNWIDKMIRMKNNSFDE